MRTFDPSRSCADTDCQAAPATTTTTTTFPPSWNALYTNALHPRCAACHGALEPEGDLGGFESCRSAIASLVNVPSTMLPERNRVTPGNPAASWLVQKIDGMQSAFDPRCAGGTCGDPMPLAETPLQPGIRDAVRAWIALGAPNDCP
jgi:hypothetical protein